MIKRKWFLITYRDNPHYKVLEWINKNNINVISVNELYHYGDGNYEISVWYRENDNCLFCKEKHR